MNLEKIGLIGGNTTRTKAYLQTLCKSNIFISKCYIMSCNEEILQNEANDYTPKASSEAEKYFAIEEPILYTLKENNISFEILAVEDINSHIICDKIKYIKEEFLIYSGFGGQILKPNLFELGKKYIHVHAGLLPQYRGSTTVYYSMLKEEICGASAIFLNAKIDEGDVIASASYSVPSDGVNIDYIYEPWVRAKVLQEALEKYYMNGEFDAKTQTNENENIYYIIHPVLKHIALMQK